MPDHFNTLPSVDIDTAGGRITQKRLRTAMRASVTSSALGMLWFAVAFGVPTTMFMEALGVSGVLIGAVVTVQQLAMIVQIPAALLLERLRERKKVWAVVTMAHRLMWFIPPVLPFLFKHNMALAAPVMLAVIGVSSILLQTVSAAWMSWMADLIPDPVKGRFWGRRQGVVMVAFLISTGFAGWLLERFPAPGEPGGSFTGFAIAFSLAAVFGAADIIVHCFVPEPRPEKHAPGENLRERLGASLREKDFLWLTLSMGMWAFSVGSVSSFGMVYLKRQFEVGYGALTAISVAAGIGTAVAGAFWGRLMDRIGCRTFGAVMMTVAPLTGISWFILNDSSLTLPWITGSLTCPQPVFIIFFSSLAAGAFYSGVGLCQFNLAGTIAPKQGRTLAMAIHWSVVGAMGAAGPLCGGRVMDWFGSHPVTMTLPGGLPFSYIHVMVLFHSLTVWLAALPLFVKISKRDVREMSLRRLVGNPLRAMSTLQNMLAMDTSSPKTRAKAVRNFGKYRTSEVTGVLMSQLDDARAEVREAVVDALGRIGTPEAVDALIEKMDDPETDLEHAIIKTLRKTRDPRIVPPLLRRLREGEKSMKMAVSRTLGEAGHRHVAPELLALFIAERDPKLAFAYAEALSRLHYTPAVDALTRFLRDAQGAGGSQRRALLLARLTGHPERFYALLSQEEAARGEGVDMLLNRLRKKAKKTAGGDVPTRSLLKKIETAFDDENYGAAILYCAELWRHTRGADQARGETVADRFFALCPELWRAGEKRPHGKTEALVAIHALGEAFTRV
ncbi:MAG: MFS transporter [Lentisphaeria bacterium]|nr:MFS transporter [Lentisphaeria bacterium]